MSVAIRSLRQGTADSMPSREEESLLTLKTASLGLAGDSGRSVAVKDLVRRVAARFGPPQDVTKAIDELVSERHLVREGETIIRPVSQGRKPVTDRSDEKLFSDLAKLLGHPLRIRILVAMSGGEAASPIGLTKRFEDVDLGTLSHHMRKLFTAGVLLLIDEQPVRGAHTHVYVLVPNSFALLRSFIEELIEAHPLAYGLE